MICPQCFAEYPPGFTTCNDCKVPLVDAAVDEWEDDLSGEMALADERREIARRFMRYGLIAVAGVAGSLLLAGRGGSTGMIPFALALSAMYVCFGISAYRYAESKGYNGMVGIGCMIFGLVGLAILLNLRDKIRPSGRR